MPYGELLPADLSDLTEQDLDSRLSELKYNHDALGTDEEQQRMKLEIAMERVKTEQRQRRLKA